MVLRSFERELSIQTLFLMFGDVDIRDKEKYSV
jgi:hypothetical protein